MDQTTPPAPLVLEPATIRKVLAGTLLATFLGGLDQMIVATALPTIGRELGDLGNLSWVITSYLLAATAVTPIYGKLADVHGRQPLLTASIFIFFAGSVLCALAPNMPVLIFARALQGIGGGGLMSLPMTIVADIIAPRERGRYQIWFSSVWIASSLLGPLLGGVLSEHVHWTAIFWINVPLCAATYLATNRVLGRLPVVRRPHRVDYAGAVLMVAATISLLLALTWGGDAYAWTSPVILGLLAFSVVAWVVFAWHLRRVSEPFFPLDLLSNKIVLAGVGNLFFVPGAMAGLTIYLPLFVETQLGLPASRAGVTLGAMMFGTVIGSYASGQITARAVHYKRPALVMSGLVIPILLVAALLPGIPVLGLDVIACLTGIGIGSIFPLSNVAVQNAVPFWQIGTATATLAFTRNLGGAVMIPAFDAVFAAAGHGDSRAGMIADGSSAATAAGFSGVFFAAAAAAALSLICLILLKEQPLRGADDHQHGTFG